MRDPAHGATPLAVVVAWSPAAREVIEKQLELPAGATVRQALLDAGVPQDPSLGGFGHLAIGVWGRKASLDQPLRDQDRVETYRALEVDPKVARRERFRAQGARGTGLFARRRPGGKAGY